MPKIESVDHLNEYRRKLKATRDPQQPIVLVCGGPGCLPLGSEEVAQAFQEAMAEKGFDGKVILKTSGCQGLCAKGVKVLIRPEEIAYQRVTPQDVPEIVETTLVSGVVVDRLVYQDPVSGESCVHKNEVPFYQGQDPIVLRKLDLIDPESLDDYLALGGYRSLRKVLFSMTPEEVVDQVERSGLRGRGGGGFLTGRKWRLCREAEGAVKFIICNGDEGDPGAFMDRAVMEGDPHAVIEGMLIGAYAIGARQGYIYVRHEYPLAVKRLKIAIDQAREFGFLGDEHPPLQFSFDIKINQGAGAFVCGEETALMSSIEGFIGEPIPRPPYPAQAGLFGLAHHHQQRGDLGQRAGNHQHGAGVVRGPGHGKQQGHQGLLPGGGGEQHRPGGSAHGHDAPRRSSLIWGVASSRTGPSRRCRPAAPRAAASPSSSWTCPWTTTASRKWAPSWARAA